MHAMTMLHRMLATNCPHIHAKRLTNLLAAVEAAVSGSRLTVSDLGRGIPGLIAAKHNIKRMDRLLGNGRLHAEVGVVYAALELKGSASLNFMDKSCRAELDSNCLVFPFI